MKKLIYTISILAVSAMGSHRASGQAATLTFTQVVTGFTQPLDIARPPADADRLFVVQKNGVVRIVKAGAMLPGNFLNVSSIIAYTAGDEQGLLSMAFHPQYATNRYFFILYTNLSGDIALARYQTSLADSNLADATSGVVVKVVSHPGQSNHNGGKLLFGTDGFLYWSTGDGGSAGDPPNNAQNGNNLLGKMLRLNVNTAATPPYHTAPVSNPFVGVAGYDSLVYQFGLRNPFRWSFDRLNGDMWIGDVGQGAWEEVDYTPAASTAGRDWGWRCREGAHVYNTTPPCAATFTDPVFEYNHTFAAGGLSITGGFVYRGALYPALYGRYICADYVSNNAWLVSPNGSGGFTGAIQTTGIPADLAGFGENNVGELFAVSLAGTMYAVSGSGTPLAVEQALDFRHRAVSGGCEMLLWNGEGASATDYIIEWSEDGRDFIELGTVAHAPYQYRLCGEQLRSGLYRLRIQGQDGSETFSATLSIRVKAQQATIQMSPVPLPNGTLLRLETSARLNEVVVHDIQGRTVYQHNVGLDKGIHRLQLPLLAPGVYMLSCGQEGSAAHIARRLIIQ